MLPDGRRRPLLQPSTRHGKPGPHSHSRGRCGVSPRRRGASATRVPKAFPPQSRRPAKADFCICGFQNTSSAWRSASRSRVLKVPAGNGRRSSSSRQDRSSHAMPCAVRVAARPSDDHGTARHHRSPRWSGWNTPLAIRLLPAARCLRNKISRRPPARSHSICRGCDGGTRRRARGSDGWESCGPRPG